MTAPRDLSDEEVLALLSEHERRISELLCDPLTTDADRREMGRIIIRTIAHQRRELEALRDVAKAARRFRVSMTDSNARFDVQTQAMDVLFIMLSVLDALAPASERKSKLEHVCGLQGFGALGDECPACRDRR